MSYLNQSKTSGAKSASWAGDEITAAGRKWGPTVNRPCEQTFNAWVAI